MGKLDVQVLLIQSQKLLDLRRQSLTLLHTSYTFNPLQKIADILFILFFILFYSRNVFINNIGNWTVALKSQSLQQLVIGSHQGFCYRNSLLIKDLDGRGKVCSSYHFYKYSEEIIFRLHDNNLFYHYIKSYNSYYSIWTYSFHWLNKT